MLNGDAMSRKSKILASGYRVAHGNEHETRRIDRYILACRSYRWLDTSLNYALGPWAHNKWHGDDPNILDMISRWIELAEMTELLGKTVPIPIPEDEEDDYRAEGLYSLSFLRVAVAEFSGYLAGAEEMRASEFRSIVRSQLEGNMEKWGRALLSTNTPESDELDELYVGRDQLEYAVQGIAALRFQDYERVLTNIDPVRVTTELSRMDARFKNIHSLVRRGNIHQQSASAPDSFWWRKT